MFMLSCTLLFRIFIHNVSGNTKQQEFVRLLYSMRQNREQLKVHLVQLSSFRIGADEGAVNQRGVTSPYDNLREERPKKKLKMS